MRTLEFQDPMFSLPHTAIMVPVHDALHHVQRALMSIVATCPAAPLAVVDDGSSAETHDWLRRFLLDERSPSKEYMRALLRNERQQLFTRTVNRGIRWAYALRRVAGAPPIDFVAVVNSDCV